MGAATGTVTVALELLVALISNAKTISDSLMAARAEGRDTLTLDEWAVVVAANDAARARLARAIADARAREATPAPPVP